MVKDKDFIDFDSMYWKALAVIYSCKTYAQFRTAKRYITLYKLGGGSCFQDIDKAVEQKEQEILSINPPF